MQNTLFRKVLVGAAAATAAIGLSTMFASPASAHASGVNGAVTCVSAAGTYEITWKLTNDYNAIVTLTNIKVVADDEKITVKNGTLPTQIAARVHKTDPLTSVTFTSTVSKPAKSVQLTYDARWADNYTAPGKSGWVELTAPCPSPSPSPSKPAEHTTPPATPSTSSTPSLPVTGSNDTLPLVGTGAALVAGGAGLVVALRRRRRIEFSAE